MSESAMLSVREVAEMLGVRTHSVLSLIGSGQLRAVDISLKPGGRPTWRIERDELDSFIRRRTKETLPPRRRKRKIKPAKDWF